MAVPSVVLLLRVTAVGRAPLLRRHKAFVAELQGNPRSRLRSFGGVLQAVCDLVVIIAPVLSFGACVETSAPG